MVTLVMKPRSYRKDQQVPSSESSDYVTASEGEEEWAERGAWETQPHPSPFLRRRKSPRRPQRPPKAGEEPPVTHPWAHRRAQWARATRASHGPSPSSRLWGSGCESSGYATTSEDEEEGAEWGAQGVQPRPECLQRRGKTPRAPQSPPKAQEEPPVSSPRAHRRVQGSRATRASHSPSPSPGPSSGGAHKRVSPQAKPEPKSKPEPEPKPKSEPEPEPKPKPSSDSESDSKSDSEDNWEKAKKFLKWLIKSLEFLIEAVEIGKMFWDLCKKVKEFFKWMF